MAELFGDIIYFGFVLFPMALCATTVAILIRILFSPARWHWYQWLIASPAIYFCWLLLFLLYLAWSIRWVGRKYPKPRHKVMRRTGRRPTKEDLGLLTVEVCYRRFALLQSLPLVGAMMATSRLRLLFLRAYSPSVHFGKSVTNWGYLYDPDLTEIGDGVFIGGRAVIAAHMASSRQSGEGVYVSAPVKIGARATIGGEARVALGCTIGEDAVVEAGSSVAPFTVIPPGEVWGGNPAGFRRRRDDLQSATNTGVLTTMVEDRDSTAPSSNEIRQLVVDALNLDLRDLPAELSCENCSSWDSLGQVAIAAAIFDRYGIVVGANELFQMRSLQGIRELLAGQIGKSQPRDGEFSLPEDPEMLPLLDAGEATRALSAQFAHASSFGTPLRVMIAASFTAQPLAMALKVWGRAYGLELDCRFASYGQVAQVLLDESEQFVVNGDGVNVILLRPEDIQIEQPIHYVEQLLDAVETFASTSLGTGRLLVGTLPPVVSALAPWDPRMISEMRHQWRSTLSKIPRVEVFEFADLIERLGIESSRSSRSEIFTRGPYSPHLYQNLGIAIVRQILAGRRSPAKVIALDCDNTLWGGVIGEVGVEGIELGSEGFGRAFEVLQAYLKQLKERGLLLAVVSKNEEHDVREVFEKHPGMVLRSSDISAWRVGWNRKSQSIREIADELGLGLNSVVFLDDDPATRMEVQSLLPEVHVVPFPADPASRCETLARLWLFDTVATTGVDRTRTRMAQEESRRQRERKSGATLEEFLASLELKVDVHAPDELEWSRIAQLTQRTNQFNLSLKRRTLEEVKAIAGNNTTCCALSAHDRFGDYGLVGVCILTRGGDQATLEMDTLLMSCRALGRGIEGAFLHEIAKLAAKQGAAILRAPFRPGPRNLKVREFLAKSGFHQTAPDLWEIPLVDIPPLPAHVHIENSQLAQSACQ